MPVQPRFRVKFLLKFKYENVDRLAFQKKFYSKTRMDGHISIREKSELLSPFMVLFHSLKIALFLPFFQPTDLYLMRHVMSSFPDDSYELNDDSQSKELSDSSLVGTGESLSLSDDDDDDDDDDEVT